ncbi:hypothetical protein L3Q82_014925, partial [Scortum barcoo]
NNVNNSTGGGTGSSSSSSGSSGSSGRRPRRVSVRSGVQELLELPGPLRGRPAAVRSGHRAARKVMRAANGGPTSMGTVAQLTFAASLAAWGVVIIADPVGKAQRKTYIKYLQPGKVTVVVQELLGKGASVLAVDENGYTPTLSCAPNRDVADCLALILNSMMPTSPMVTITALPALSLTQTVINHHPTSNHISKGVAFDAPPPLRPLLLQAGAPAVLCHRG